MAGVAGEEIVYMCPKDFRHFDYSPVKNEKRLRADRRGIMANLRSRC